MGSKLFLAIFSSVFLAELGDKTQLATMLFASDGTNPKLTVFLALVATSAIGVVAGSAISQFVSPRMLGIIAGLGFIAIGAWTLLQAWKG